MNSRESGIMGERAASGYLEEKGYRIIEKNFRCRLGEIDIIACNGTYLVFAEVKTRKNSSDVEAKEYVGYQKQSRIIKTAGLYLSQHSTELQPRFDVIEVYYNDKGSISSVIHLEDAFR